MHTANNKIIRYIKRQVKEVVNGGLSAMAQKGRALLALPAAALILLIVRLLRPIVTIRFGPMLSGRIGYFTGYTEVYLYERKAGLYGKRLLDIFYYPKYICNHQLAKMWKRVKGIHIFSFASRIDRLNRLLPGGKRHMIQWRPDSARDINDFMEHNPPHLWFTPEEEVKGHDALKELGMPPKAPFVCFFSRSSHYLDAMFPDKDWSYHDFRDSDVKNFIPAVEELTRRGYFTARIGAAVKEPLDVSNPMIIDYAAKARTEFLDIFLGGKCHFFLGDSCGIDGICMVFRRPLAIVNMLPLEYVPTWSSKLVFIPKKLWLRKEKRFLKFQEILDSKLGRFAKRQEYEEAGIDPIENTPIEISDLAVEMDKRLKGEWQTTEEDEELQRRFWGLFKVNEVNQVFRARIGREFLRQNRELLE